MLQMLIDNFQIRSDKGIYYHGFYYFGTSGNTGFVIACYKNNIKIIEILTERYPDIIE